MEDDISSIRVKGNCEVVLLYDEDECSMYAPDNILVDASLAKLPSDLDNDVCKITLRASMHHGGPLCKVSLYAEPNYQSHLKTSSTNSGQGETFFLEAASPPGHRSDKRRSHTIAK